MTSSPASGGLAAVYLLNEVNKEKQEKPKESFMDNFGKGVLVTAVTLGAVLYVIPWFRGRGR